MARRGNLKRPMLRVDAVRLQLGLRLRLQPLPAPWRIVELPNGLAVDDTNWHTSPARMGRRKLELLRRTQRRIGTPAARHAKASHAAGRRSL